MANGVVKDLVPDKRPRPHRMGSAAHSPDPGVLENHVHQRLHGIMGKFDVGIRSQNESLVISHCNSEINSELKDSAKVYQRMAKGNFGN